LDSRVTIRIDGAEHRFAMERKGRTVLEAADAHGLQLPSQCRAGICATCRCRLTLGRVHLVENLVLDEAELAAGYVLACCAQPLTDEIELEYES
jgi:ferredoxin